MTNTSESFNKVLKTWTSWREMPIEVAVLAFYTLFHYYNIDYDHAKYGIGDFKLNTHIPLRPANEMLKREIIERGNILQYCRFGQVCIQLPQQCFKVTENGNVYLV
uniref:Uncharacterized protein n=1 Tax=Romanomermis culicivorax TaxID=13658 RepID=A0A915JAH5_ROMCU